MPNYPLIPLESVVFALSEALDSADPHLVNHQLRVSYISRMVGRELGFRGRELESLVVAGALHDIGLFTAEERTRALEEDSRILEKHTRIGYLMLREFPYLRRAAEFILHHHTPWETLRDEVEDPWVALGGNILHLADTLETRLRGRSPLLLHTSEITGEVRTLSARFAPEVLEALRRVSEAELFWLRLERFEKETELVFQVEHSTYLPCGEMESLAALFSLVVDLKSPFTRVHSAGVAEVATWLGEALGFSPYLLSSLRVAGYLHDLGKLAVPDSILNKPGRLTEEEWAVMKAHPFITYRILERIPHFETINAWASSHHERLDGRGYPARLSAGDLSLGARVMAVADVTTAILEDRPYRAGMSLREARKVLQKLSGHALDPELTALVSENLDHVRELIREVRRTRLERFEIWGYIPPS
ncbi:HD domain-containing phosphohydrolase [Thermosulfurimonas sp. F29]|uniref:HD domain-containing phosphohydrolase n=1 Tax=Thermosulfurimonas sp. F29 TaxID=2867247 RepID=UPI001C828609|nr:HD domain-containing protein [Thermosulfurimonas sp. F29]MBX6422571.1 HD domain-containing protein [Thermosulfurimonas sp. F29]